MKVAWRSRSSKRNVSHQMLPLLGPRVHRATQPEVATCTILKVSRQHNNLTNGKGLGSTPATP